MGHDQIVWNVVTRLLETAVEMGRIPAPLYTDVGFHFYTAEDRTNLLVTANDNMYDKREALEWFRRALERTL